MRPLQKQSYVTQASSLYRDVTRAGNSIVDPLRNLSDIIPADFLLLYWFAKQVTYIYYVHVPSDSVPEYEALGWVLHL